MKMMNAAARRSALISLLRDESRWPSDFRWDYGRVSGCALGLYLRLIHPRGEEFVPGSQVFKELNLADEVGFLIFCELGTAEEIGRQEVTAGMVADKLEEVHRALVGKRGWWEKFWTGGFLR